MTELADRPLTDASRAELKRLREEGERNREDQRLIEQADDARRELDTRVGDAPARPEVDDAGARPWIENDYRRGAPTRSHDEGGPTGPEWRSMWGCRDDRIAPLERAGFNSFREFVDVMTAGRFDERLQELRKMNEGTPTDGGFMVSEEYGAMLMDGSLEREIVRPRATIWPMSGKTRKVPAWAGSDHSSSLFGGLTATWGEEGGTNSETYAKTRLVELTAGKLSCYTGASNELAEDGMDFASQLRLALVTTVSWNLDYAFLQGSGAGEPRGVLNDPALVTVAKEAGQAADTIVYDNCVKMFARLHPALYDGAVWVANVNTLPQLMTMSFPVGTGGSLAPVVRDDGQVLSMFRTPIVLTEKLPTLGDMGDLILCNFSQYAVGLRRDVRLDMSQAVHWSTDEAAFRAIVRADGQGTWDEPITPKHGDTLSWCVALAERS